MENYFKGNEDGNISPASYGDILDNTITTNTTLEKDRDSGASYLVATDGLEITLPAASTPGLEYEFINGGAAGAVGFTVKVQATDTVIGTIPDATANIVLTGTTAKGVVHTKATTQKGDRITLRSDGTTTWYIVNGSGIFAQEA